MTLAWTPISVIVPEKWIDRCREFGMGRARNQREERGRNYSRWSGRSSAANLGLGKLGEVAAVLGCGGDPEVLDWDIKFDMVKPTWDFLLGKLKVEVKSSDNPQGKLIVYPVDRIRHFDAAEMDVMMFVWMAKPKTKNFGYCELRGWTLKDEFKLNKHIVTKAEWRRYHMSAGTWVLNQDFLMPMGTLVEREWRDVADLRSETFGSADGVTKARQINGGNGGVESRSGQ